ncbi:MAG: TMEM14 family protein [Leptolyngbya sp. SIO1E4]|nr:TMEM14 family protein [Leptolyngbya sp. SIO1E4]
MSAAAIMTFVYGVLSIVGGIIGYRQAGSKPSLIAGGVTGALLLIAGIGLVQVQPWGMWLAIAITALLIITFIGRLVKTRKFMPAGLMIIVGVATLATLLKTLG